MKVIPDGIVNEPPRLFLGFTRLVLEHNIIIPPPFHCERSASSRGRVKEWVGLKNRAVPFRCLGFCDFSFLSLRFLRTLLLDALQFTKQFFFIVLVVLVVLIITCSHRIFRCQIRCALIVRVVWVHDQSGAFVVVVVVHWRRQWRRLRFSCWRRFADGFEVLGLAQQELLLQVPPFDLVGAALSECPRLDGHLPGKIVDMLPTHPGDVPAATLFLPADGGVEGGAVGCRHGERLPVLTFT
mmetsp:Transcript_38633/g.88635  ORF Transcript_38633/g.88635 Transcript_38633/m.88635 type:complete len:240 (+) Transcript_38633:519-1238(+)